MMFSALAISESPCQMACSPRLENSNESPSLSPPFKNKKTQPVHKDGARSTPNYMKSTSSFEAKKEKSPKTTILKVARKMKMDDLASGKKDQGYELAFGNRGSRMSSLKTQHVHDDGARSTPNYMKSNSISFEERKEQSPNSTTPKVATKLKMDDLASGNKGSRTSSLKKFPAYLQLDHGRTESERTSSMKVYPYTYCSLNGHHHAPLPPLKCFLSAKRRALKTQKSFKVGCLSPSQKTPIVKKDNIKEPVIVATEAPQKVDTEKENRDLFSDDNDDFCKEKNQKTGDDRLYSKLQQLYDGETMTSGASSEEDGDSESKDHDIQNYNESEVPSTTTESDENDKMDEIQGLISCLEKRISSVALIISMKRLLKNQKRSQNSKRSQKMGML
nr:hypothetical protein [Tanacetum cinerariifolium]